MKKFGPEVGGRLREARKTANMSSSSVASSSYVSLEHYRMMEYGDTVVPHNLSQRLFDVATNPLRFIANALNSVKSPNLMSNSNVNSSNSTINIGTIELPSVTNGENFIKQLQLIATNR